MNNGTTLWSKFKNRWNNQSFLNATKNLDQQFNNLAQIKNEVQKIHNKKGHKTESLGYPTVERIILLDKSNATMEYSPYGLVWNNQNMQLTVTYSICGTLIYVVRDHSKKEANIIKYGTSIARAADEILKIYKKDS